MVSAALDEYLAAHGDGETYDSLASKPPIKEPEPFDGSQPLTHYILSSSHNTYLLSNQLWGAASPKAYTTALQGLNARAPARCVEIDVWWTKKGPIVTHGHTFTGSIPFKDVCQAIGDAVTPNDLPVFISLECHVDATNQPELVKIMKETWGDKLISTKLEHLEGKKVSPDDLRGRIALMVEWYPTPGAATNAIIKLNEEGSAASSSSEDDSDNSEVEEMKAFRKSHHNNKTKICDELANLGIYANSIKPKEGWLQKELVDPLHALINISESALLDLLKKKESLDLLIHHGQEHLRRCYPKGLRVNSENMDPVPIWRSGTHVVGMNMQHWDKGTHLNGALFRDTDGYVLKPQSLRGGEKRTGTAHLKLTVVGGDDIPRGNKDHPNEAVYISAKLYTHVKNYEWKTKTVKGHNGDPMWNESVEWSYLDDDLVFLKVELKRDDWGKDDELASYSVLVDRLEQGLRLWPLFDSAGSPSVGRLMVKVEYTVE